MAVDNELADEQLQQVNRHLAQCATCRQELERQGTLDMLLKRQFAHEPPEGYEDTLWCAVSEQLDSGDGELPGGGGDEEVVFHTSPAMQYLNIPERRPKPVEAPSASTPVAPAPSPWRWPVSLIVSTAIVVVGYLAYQRMTPKEPPPEAVAMTEPEATQPAFEESEPESEPTSEPDPSEEIKVAALTPGVDAGLAPTEARPEARSEPKRRRRAPRRVAAKRKPTAAKEPEPKAAPPPPKPAAKPGKPAKPGAKTTLDTLLDDAIGGPAKTKKPAPVKESAPAASDLPDQLTMNQIRSSMGKVKGRVQACYDQFQVEGMASVQFTIVNDGKIKAVSIRGKFRGTDTGDCVVKAVKRARFPRFAGKPMTIKKYPFLLQ